MVIGDSNAPVLVVMPSAPDDGMLIWFFERMRECGITRSDICVIYILEEPPANSGNRPSVAQIREATARVKQEIAECNPRVVMPLGADAVYMTTGLKIGIEDCRGYLIGPEERGPFSHDTWQHIGEYKTSSKKYNRAKGDPKYGWVKTITNGLLPTRFTGWVIPGYTLDSIQSQSFSTGPAFKADAKRVRRALDNTLRIVDYEMTIVTTPSHDFSTAEYLALDIETVGAENRIIERICLSDGTVSVTILWDETTRQYVQEQIDKCSGYIVVHNVPFDYPRLRESGVDFTKIVDTRRLLDSMYMAVVVQPDLRKGLGSVASLYLDNRMWKHKSGDDPAYYNAMDGFKTVRIVRDGIRPLAEQLRMWPLISGEEYQWGPGVMATIPTLSDMTEGGIRINKKYALEWSIQLTEKLRGHVEDWTRTLPECDPGSPKEVAELLYYKWKLPIVRTKEDGITTNEFALVKTKAYIQSAYAQVQDKGPWKDDPRCTPELFDLLLNIRETNKNLGTYCSPMLLYEDDFVHPSYLPMSKFRRKDEDDKQAKGSAATGRLAASNPNIQNQPYIARHLFVPSRDELCFIQWDFNKAELFAMAAMSHDTVMWGDLSSDPYQRVADSVGSNRPTAKNVVLAGQYLAGAQKVSDMILKQQHFYVAPAECKRILDGIAKRWYKRTAYIRSLIMEVCGNRQTGIRGKGYCINPFGRVRVFHDRRAASVVDFIPQSIVADILWCVLRSIADYLRSIGGRLVTTVHDSILAEITEDKLPVAIEGVRRIMQRTFDCVSPGFYIPVSHEVGAPGASWGSLK